MKKILYIFLLFPFVNLSSQDYLNISESEFQTTLNTPVKIVKKKDGHYFIDFGKAFFGSVQFSSKLSQQDSIIFHLGEKLSSTATLDRNPGGSIRYQSVKLLGFQSNETITLQLPINKKHINPPAIQLPRSFGTIMPFRYIEIENLKTPIGNFKIFQKALHYKFNDEASYFSSSDTILDAVWNLCKHSIKATSFTGFYIDGDRERLPYEADAYINQLSHYSLDNEYTMARRTNAYFLEHPTWPTEWLLHTVPLFYEDYMYTGDLTVLEKNYEALKIKTLVDLERSDGLISSSSEKMNREFMRRLGFTDSKKKIKDIVDWPPGQRDTGWKLKNEAGERDGYDMLPINTVVNAFYYHNIVLMGRISEHLKKTQEVIFWKEKEAKVKKMINTKLFDVQKGIYIDGEGSIHSSLHANMFPLAFGLVSEEKKKGVVDFIKSRGMACSVYGAQYLLDGLYDAQEAEYALKLMSAKHDRSWYNMIKIGSTITLEAWDSAYKPNLDWNHAWGAVPANIITRRLWGITPKTPGFETATIRPQLGGLTFSKIKVPTMKGNIIGNYRRKGRKEIFELTLPKEMAAEFVLSKHAGKVVVNGKIIRTNANDPIFLQSGINTVVLEK